jgi:DnaD/phage-associated family protein
MTIERGQVVTSVARIAQDTRLSTQVVRTCLNRLKSTNEITSESTSKYTIITISKYDTYQDGSDDDNEEDNKEINKQITNEQQTNNKQITTNKNEKNDKNEKNVRSSSCSLERVVEFYNNNISLITPFEFEKLQSYIDMEEDLIIYAMQKAVLSNVRKFRYIEKILMDWKAQGFTTLIQAKNEENEYKNKNIDNETDEERIARKTREMEERLKYDIE